MLQPAGYTEDQAGLRRQGDTSSDDGDGDDLHITIPQGLPEVNPDVYRDIDPLLFKGFVHTQANINDVQFVFKSLNQHEFEMLRLMQPDISSRKEINKFQALFLAYGVFMVDGINILIDRDRHVPDLADFFANLGISASNKVVRHLSEINRRANRATILTEAFCMEPASRLRWAHLRGLDLTIAACTGLSGTQTLGMNWSQLTWRALNYYDDMKETAEREWENSKFVASSMAGKGMSQVHSQDKRRREREREDKLERRDKILRFALLGESMDQANTTAPMQVARTVEELSTQLERDLKGEKDWHDLVVDSHERRVTDEKDQRVQHLRELQQGFDEQYGPQRVAGESSLQGMTAEEVRFQIERRRQLTAQRLASQSHPELMDPKQAEFAEKWCSISKTTRDPAQVPMSAPDRKPGIPFRTAPKK